MILDSLLFSNVYLNILVPVLAIMVEVRKSNFWVKYNQLWDFTIEFYNITLPNHILHKYIQTQIVPLLTHFYNFITKIKFIRNHLSQHLSKHTSIIFDPQKKLYC